ncbi:MAG: glycine zipper 2TM domain-containing protein [Pseudomonadota bacterium]
MKQLALITAAGSLAVIAAPAQAAEMKGAFSPSLTESSIWAAPIEASYRYGDDDWDDWDDDDRYYHRGRRYRGDRIYDRRGRYVEPRRIGRRDRVWRGRDGRYYCRRDNGTTGLVIGAGVGALLGNEVAGRGDKLLGTIIGGVAGGLLGREIDRGDLRCR